LEKTLGQLILSVVQWTIAIVSVLGTLALFAWIAVMFFKKDRK
jgi:hypothetical protein